MFFVSLMLMMCLAFVAMVIYAIHVFSSINVDFAFIMVFVAFFTAVYFHWNNEPLSAAVAAGQLSRDAWETLTMCTTALFLARLTISLVCVVLAVQLVRIIALRPKAAQ